MNDFEVKRFTVEIETVGDGNFMTGQAWYHCGKLHNEFGPAIIRYEPYSGSVLSEHWYRDGKPFRDSAEGASVVKYDAETHHIVEELYLVDEGRLHRVDGPALIRRHRETGCVIEKEFHRNGERYFPEGREFDIS